MFKIIEGTITPTVHIDGPIEPSQHYLITGIAEGILDNATAIQPIGTWGIDGNPQYKGVMVIYNSEVTEIRGSFGIAVLRAIMHLISTIRSDASHQNYIPMELTQPRPLPRGNK